MDANHWERVKEIFAGAGALERSAVGAYLDQACAGDAALRADVESLLEAHQVSDAVLDRPAAEYLPADALDPVAARWVGRRIGAYELVALIGHGGMGEVYRARRVDAQFEMAVAIKLVRAGFDSQYLQDRFRAERQILATLDHPGIARLLDGGATEEGLPYLVMELVDGEPIDRYCENRQLSIPARLAIFRAVCTAVSYAHQRLVVHRDLKPSNILVSADGSVKLLDFGIAKLLQASADGDVNPATMTAMTALTPAFSSPEQLQGAPVTTTSDVYSLGVVLYHLLTGRSPYRSRMGSTAEAIREVCDTAIARPSAAVAESQAARAARAIPSRDLDDITLMALRKEPDRRYASVEQLSADIERYLRGEPVAAHGGEFGYRAGKFARRHTVEIAAGVALVATLVGGIVVSTRAAHTAQLAQIRAERDFARVRGLANALLFELHDAIKDLPGATAAQQLVVSRARQYLDELATENSSDDELNRELAVAYKKLGDIQGGVSSQNTGDLGAAVESYRASVAQLEAIYTRHPENLDAGADFARSLRALAIGEYMAGNLDRAVAGARRAVDVAAGVQRRDPGNTKRLHDLAVTKADFCVTLSQAGRFDEAFAVCRESMAIQERVVAVLPDNAAEQRVLEVIRGRNVNAITDAFAQSKAGVAELRSAAELGRKAVASGARRVAANADDELAVRDLYADHNNLGNALFLQGDHAGALDEFRQALKLLKDLEHRDPENVGLRINESQIWQNVTASYVKLKQAPAALEAAKATLELVHGLSDAQKNALAVNIEAAVLVDVGRSHELLAAAPRATAAVRLTEWRAAGRAFEESQKIYAGLNAHGGVVSNNMPDLAFAAAGIERSKAAVRALVDAGTTGR